MRSIVEAESSIIKILENCADGMSKGVLFDHAPHMPRKYLRAAFDKLMSEGKLKLQPIGETGLIRYRLTESHNQTRKEGDK